MIRRLARGAVPIALAVFAKSTKKSRSSGNECATRSRTARQSIERIFRTRLQAEEVSDSWIVEKSVHVSDSTIAGVQSGSERETRGIARARWCSDYAGRADKSAWPAGR